MSELIYLQECQIASIIRLPDGREAVVVDAPSTVGPHRTELNVFLSNGSIISIPATTEVERIATPFQSAVAHLQQRTVHHKHHRHHD